MRDRDGRRLLAMGKAIFRQAFARPKFVFVIIGGPALDCVIDTLKRDDFDEAQFP